MKVSRILSMLLIGIGITFTSCEKEPAPIPVTGITIDSSSMTLTEGETAKLTATISPSNADNQGVIWSSSNSSVASVSNGTVTAVAAGSAIITAKSDDGGKTAECNIVVKAEPKVQFEDDNFKAYCVGQFDKDGDGEISIKEALAVTHMTANSNKITSLGGIEYFENLTSLDCSLSYSRGIQGNDGIWHYYDVSGNEVVAKLTTLDVSKNTALTYLYCVCNPLTSLDVSKNTALTTLYCSNNQLTSLNVSGCSALTELYCNDNQLTSLNVSDFIALTYLNCEHNQLTSLDVSGCTSLTELYCSNNHLISLEISKNTTLTYLSCNNNPYLTEIWLGKDQTIPSSFYYDINVATIKRYGVWEAVDLGLSVKWASFNLGAEAPWEFGDYYAWGETETKSDYSEKTYKFFKSEAIQEGQFVMENKGYTKYIPQSQTEEYGFNGFYDNKTILDPEDDIAHVLIGGKWRMPTDSEFSELRNNCTWQWVEYKGITGYKVTSNVNEYTDRWIFMPAAGSRYDTILDTLGLHGFYWSSSLYSDAPCAASLVILDWDNVRQEINLRCYGASIRPVCE